MTLNTDTVGRRIGGLLMLGGLLSRPPVVLGEAVRFAPAPDAVAVTLLTGFLGSGKTSLLNAILSDPQFADTAIIVNE